MKHGFINASLLSLLSIIFGVLLCSTPGIIVPVNATFWAGISRRVRNTARRAPGYEQLRNLIRLGQSTPDNILKSMRRTYNSALDQGIEVCRPLLLREMEPSMKIFKQDMSAEFPRRLKPYLEALLDIAPRGTMPGEEYRTRPVQLFFNKVNSVWKIPADATPSNRMPGGFSTTPARTTPNEQPNNSVINNVASVFRIPADVTPSNHMPGGFPTTPSEVTTPPPLPLRREQQVNADVPPPLPPRPGQRINAPVPQQQQQRSTTSSNNAIMQRQTIFPPLVHRHLHRYNKSNNAQNADSGSSNQQMVTATSPQLSRQLLKLVNYIFTCIQNLLLLDIDQIIIIWNDQFKDFMLNFLLDNMVAHTKKRTQWEENQYYPNIIRLEQLKAEEIEQLEAINEAIAQRERQRQQQQLQQRQQRRIVVCGKFQRPDLGSEINTMLDFGSKIVQWPGQTALQKYRTSSMATSNNPILQKVRNLVESNPDVCGIIREKLLAIYRPLHEFTTNLLKQPFLRVLKRSLYQKIHKTTSLFADQF
ncbi:hypothetical protein BDF22DRAFT_666594 [Syncephalis plumigaleata]|nr:hypothetical protein BDF22DRAFT_666594 [Syncephalis plumigaleata]